MAATEKKPAETSAAVGERVLDVTITQINAAQEAGRVVYTAAYAEATANKTTGERIGDLVPLALPIYLAAVKLAKATSEADAIAHLIALDGGKRKPPGGTAKNRLASAVAHWLICPAEPTPPAGVWAVTVSRAAALMAALADLGETTQEGAVERIRATTQAGILEEAEAKRAERAKAADAAGKPAGSGDAAGQEGGQPAGQNDTGKPEGDGEAAKSDGEATGTASKPGPVENLAAIRARVAERLAGRAKPIKIHKAQVAGLQGDIGDGWHVVAVRIVGDGLEVARLEAEEEHSLWAALDIPDDTGEEIEPDPADKA